MHVLNVFKGEKTCFLMFFYLQINVFNIYGTERHLPVEIAVVYCRSFGDVWLCVHPLSYHSVMPCISSARNHAVWGRQRCADCGRASPRIQIRMIFLRTRT